MNILDELWKVRKPYDTLFLSIINGYTIKESEDYPNEIFYIKNNRVLIDYDKKTKFAYINYEIWYIFESKFLLNYQEIRDLLMGMLETHLKMRGITPATLSQGWNYKLETHLKLKGNSNI